VAENENAGGVQSDRGLAPDVVETPLSGEAIIRADRNLVAGLGTIARPRSTSP
jgi:hypothetical protein